MKHLPLAILIGALSLSQSKALEIVSVDIHERLYPDRWPTQVPQQPLSVPRGAPVTLQFAVRGASSGNAKLQVNGITVGSQRLHWLQSVHVEGNTQGSMKNRPGGEVPKGWMDQLVRAAPFDTLEALVESDTMPILAGRTHGVIAEFQIPRDAEPGIYKGALHVSLGDHQATAPFSFRVHQTTLPEKLPLHSVHWLQALPANLTSGDAPDWWSEEHWQLLEVAGKQLLRFGDDTMFTPLINYREPLIQVTRRNDGTYAFDYSRFDRWCELFLGLGFQHISGHHIVSMGAKTFVTDEATGKKEPLLKDPKDRQAWLAFLPTFYSSFHAHLKQKGWLKRYAQCQYDEPSDEKLYLQLTELARKHMPGVSTCDAINNRANQFSPLVDTQVFSLLQLNKHQKIAEQRNAEGKGVWLYHCTSPYPPNPNRHIDSLLTESRLYPWLCHKLGANGFLFWAANHYRGADEYKSSIGPFPAPKNNQDPGHPPGDNWFYYRSPEGLRPSIRIVAHREGMIDHALLTQLARHDRELFNLLIEKTALSITKFERSPAKYHQNRTAMLEALDRPVVQQAVRYPLDNNLADADGRTKASKVGAPEFSSEHKRHGTHSIRFNGLNDSLSIPADLRGDFTIACWAKYEKQTTGGSVWRPMIYSGSNIDKGAIMMSFQRDGAADPGQIFMGVDTKKSFDIEFDNGDWHFLALTLKGDAWKAYHNGKLLGEGLAKTHSSDGKSLKAGGDPSHKSRNFKGYVDDLRFYSRPLTGDEVSTLHQSYP